jgi:Protein of unknown function (DUF3443)
MLAKSFRAAFTLSLCVGMAACGGGSKGSGTVTPPPPVIPPAGSNVVSVVVDQGPLGQSVNTLFVSVKLCVPGSTTNCQTIDHIQVDTGSYGLRVLAPVLTLTLPTETLPSGGTLAQCTVFVDGYSWGPIVTADVTIGGESASSMPIQSIGDSRYTSVPADCSASGTEEDTVMAFGANGIMGVGPFETDCPACATMLITAEYYSCATPSTCVNTMVEPALQPPNPATRFVTDNNGVIIDLPAVPDAGVATVTGSMIFGIDTQSNNQSGTQTVLNVNGKAELTMTYNGQPLNDSFIDSGSNGIFFNDSSIAKCQAPANDPTSGIVDFYCPANTLSLGLSIQGANGVMANNLVFGVGNAQTMLQNNPTGNAFPQLAGSISDPQTFDYGLAFFYGRRVAVVVQGSKTTAGTGPYIAF